MVALESTQNVDDIRKICSKELQEKVGASLCITIKLFRLRNDGRDIQVSVER